MQTHPILAPLVDLAAALVELALPSRCAACDDHTPADAALCALCAFTLDPIDDGCPRCALPLPPPSPGLRPAPCIRCQASPPPFTRTVAPFAFAGELQTAIRRWKIGGDVTRTAALARLLAPAIDHLMEPLLDSGGPFLDERVAFPDEPVAFVPVPLHPARLRAREFNQASVLIRAARKRRHPPVREWLDRTIDTSPQSTLDAAARRHNLRHAFVVPDRARPHVAGARLVLVDDVMTTGATADACARALLAAGAARVDVLVLARTPPHAA